MQEFFRGWRQKTGILTLILACVFLTAWVRSLILIDRIVVCISPTSRQQFGTDYDAFWFVHETANGPDFGSIWLLDRKAIPRPQGD